MQPPSPKKLSFASKYGALSPRMSSAKLKSQKTTVNDKSIVLDDDNHWDLSEEEDNLDLLDLPEPIYPNIVNIGKISHETTLN